MRGFILGLALLSLVGTAHADNGTVLRRALSIDSVSDLAALCHGAMDRSAAIRTEEEDRDKTYRLLSCISYIRGAHALYASYQAAFGTRTLCLPTGTTLGEQIGAFLTWADANRDRGAENAGQGFIVSLVRGFPCAGEAPERSGVGASR